MKNQTTKQHRLNTGAQKVVTDWASLTGWSESRTASWFIITTEAALRDRLCAEQARAELNLTVEKHVVEKKARKLMAQANLKLSTMFARRRQREASK